MIELGSPLDPLSGYYADFQGNIYSVASLVIAARDLEPFDAPIECIDIGKDITWGKGGLIDMAEHVQRIMNVDMSKPIILDWNGSLADGYHRVIKAIIDGKDTIKAVRLINPITPVREE